MSVGKDKNSTWTGMPRDGLTEDVISAHDDWREECSRVRWCYSHWANAPRAERSRAYAAYASALDREESAANDYRRRVINLNKGELGLGPTRDRGPSL